MDLIIGWSMLAGTFRKLDITSTRSSGRDNYKNMIKKMVPKKIRVAALNPKES